MDAESVFIVIALMIVECMLFNIYFPFPTGFILSLLVVGIIIVGAGKVEKHLNNKQQIS